MMIAGGLMIGMGLLMMALVFGLPILLIFAVIGGTGSILHRQNQQATTLQDVRPVNLSGSQAAQPATAPARYCPHCGAGLQAEWTHCPQCGAPVGE